MVKIEITLEENAEFENDKIKITSISTQVKSTGIKATIGEVKVNDKIRRFIEGLN